MITRDDVLMLCSMAVADAEAKVSDRECGRWN